MKCKNCGGELIFQNGMGVCESCKNTYRLDYGFENTEVYICYVESDAQGRRSKDSIIAEELYQKLERKKIHTFYERRSAPALIGDDLQAANYQAIYHAKIILVVGISVAHFRHLALKYNKYFSGKTVIPVYTDIRPEDLPQELNRVQALNFSTIGADTDLLNGILRILGREKELELENLQQRAGKRKKITAIILSLLVIIGIAATAVYLFFRESPTEPESEPVLTSQDIYDNAQALMESGDYLGAADLFASISDFRNSTNLLNEIYNRYDGYYKSEDRICSLYLNIIDSHSAEIIFEKSLDGQVVRVTETAIMVDNTISAKYIDSLSNEGEILLTLMNDRINVDITTDMKSSDFFIGELSVQFLQTQKEDRPFVNEISKESILSWVKKQTYLEDVKRAGYELEYVGGGYLYSSVLQYEYKIANTNILIITTNGDLTKYTGQYSENPPMLDKDAIIAVIAPIDFIYPNKIGQSANVFCENEVVYVPNAYGVQFFYSDSLEFLNISVAGSFEFYNTMDSRTMSELLIKSDSMIGITSKILIGEYNYNMIVGENEKIYYRTLVLQQYQKDNPNKDENSRTLIKILSEKDKALLVCVHEKTSHNNIIGESKGSYHYYRFDLITQKATFIVKQAAVPYYNSYGSLKYNYDGWKNYPEFFGEFLTESS